MGGPARLDLARDFGYLTAGADLLAAIEAAFEAAFDAGFAAADGQRVVAGLARAVGLFAERTRSWDEQRQRLRYLEPALRAAATVAPAAASTALFHLGTADERDLRAVIAAAHHHPDAAEETAIDLLRRTGEAGPVTAALRRKDPSTDVIAVILRRVLLTGSDPPEAALTALAEIIRPMPVDTSIPMRLLAAHLRLRMGDPAEATRLVPVGLTHPLAHDHAVRIAIELRDPALAPVLRNHLAGSLTPFTARALLDFGVDRADLTEPMLRWLTGCDEHDPIVQACTDLLDPTALPGLRALADTDNRVRVGREHSSVIWHDERHRHAVLTGIAAIEARA